MSESSSSLQILPPTIDPAWGCWTFLTRGQNERQLADLVLVLDALTIRPSNVDTTTAISRLWTFNFAPFRSVTTAHVILHRSQLPDSVCSLVPSDEAALDRTKIARGKIDVRFFPGKIGYVPGAPERQLSDLSNTDPSLMTILRQIGARSVQKVQFAQGEQPATFSTPRGPVTSRSGIGRRYFVIIDSLQCERAMAKILMDCPAVEWAYVDALVTEFAPEGGPARRQTE